MAQASFSVTLIRSGINRPEQHQDGHISGLGSAAKMHGKTVTLPDNASVRGMIRAVSHLVKVEASRARTAKQESNGNDTAHAQAAREGATRNRKRIGRGLGSGLGKTRARASRARRPAPATTARARLRGRPDADAAPPAEARLQEPASARVVAVNVGDLDGASTAGTVDATALQRRHGAALASTPSRSWARASSPRSSPSRRTAFSARPRRRSRRPAARPRSSRQQAAAKPPPRRPE